MKSQNTWVIASIYNPKHRIYVHDDGGKLGYMIGRFIANYIDGHAKFVTWNNYDCAMPPPPPPVAAVNPGETDNTVVAKMEVTAYPNPSSASFSLKLKTGASGDVIIRVHSISGKLMQEVKGTPDQIFRVGDGLVPGIYIAELTQGDEKVMVKLVKQ